MAVGDVYRVQIQYAFGSELTMNVIHLREKTAETEANPAEFVAEHVHTRLAATIMTVLSEDVTVPVIHVRRIYPLTGIPFILVPGGAGFAQLVGEVTGDPLPSQTAGLISLYTAENSKRGQGRVYIPGLPEASGHSGRLNLASFGDFQTAGQSFATADFGPAAPGVGVYDLCVWSRSNEVAYPVTAAVVHTNLATIRGRRQHAGYAN